MKRKHITWTDEKAVTHATGPGGFTAHCGINVPINYNGAMPGWPPPPRRDWSPRPVTCFDCLMRGTP